MFFPYGFLFYINAVPHLYLYFQEGFLTCSPPPPVSLFLQSPCSPAPSAVIMKKPALNSSSWNQPTHLSLVGFFFIMSLPVCPSILSWTYGLGWGFFFLAASILFCYGTFNFRFLTRRLVNWFIQVPKGLHMLGFDTDRISQLQSFLQRCRFIMRGWEANIPKVFT